MLNLENLPDKAPTPSGVAPENVGVSLDALPDNNASTLSGLYKQNPASADEYAKTRKLSRVTGLPMPTVQNQPGAAAKAAAEPDWASLETLSPKTAAELVKSTDLFNLSKDDTENLSWWERTLNATWRATKRGFTTGMQGLDAQNTVDAVGMLDTIARIERGELTTPEQIRAVPKYGPMLFGYASNPAAFAKIKEQYTQRLNGSVLEYLKKAGELRTKELTPTTGLQRMQDADSVGDFAAAVAANPSAVVELISQSIGTIGPYIPFIIGGGVAGGAPGLAATTGIASFTTEYTTAFSEVFQEQGITLENMDAARAAIASPEFKARMRDKLIKAGVIGAFDAATAGVAGRVLAPAKVGGTALTQTQRQAINIPAQVTVQAVGGGSGEALGSVAAGEEIKIGAVLSEAIAEAPGGVVDVALLATKRALEDNNKVQEAMQDAQRLEQMLRVAAASKLRERDPDTFAQFVQQMASDTEGALTEVYIDAQTLVDVLNQAGVEQGAFIGQVPSVADQLQDAMVGNAPVAIPIGEFTANVVGTGLESALLPHLRTAPDALSLTEAQVASEKAGEYLQTLAQDVIKQAQDAEGVRVSADAVKANILDQLNSTKRFTSDVNEAYANLVRDFYTATAGRLGMSPEQMYQRYPLRIRAEGMPDADVLRANNTGLRRIVSDATATAVETELKNYVKGGDVDPLSPEQRTQAETQLAPLAAQAAESKGAFDELIRNIARPFGLAPKLAPVKGLKRAAEKLVLENGGDVGTIRDMLRATVVVPRVEDINAAIEAVQANFEIVPGRIKNRFETPTESGYRDVLINVRLPNGLQAEVQITVPAMLEAKDSGHKLYEMARVLPEGDARRAKFDALQSQLYAEAFDSATRASNSAAPMGVPYENTLAGSGYGRTPAGDTATQLPSGSRATAMPSTSNSLASGGRSNIESSNDSIADAEVGVFDQAGITVGRALFEDIIAALDLTEAEVNSTALKYMTGLSGARAFMPPSVGGLTDVVAFLHADRLGTGLPRIDIKTPEGRTQLARMMAAEALASIRNAGDSLAWYDATVRTTLSLMAVKYPELNTDPRARNAFLLATAISSQTMNVEDNLKFASEQYEAYRQTVDETGRGRFPEVGTGKSLEAMGNNFKKANDLMAEMGPELFRQFLVTPFTAGELNKAGFSIDEKVDELVLGSAVFGPKIGFGFYSNLNGNFEPVTMDMWFMRTIGRLTGTLPSFEPTKFAMQLGKFRNGLDERGDNGVFADQFDPALVERARTDEAAAIELARLVFKAHEKDFKVNRAAYDDETRQKSTIVKAADTMLKSLDKPKDIPANGSERQNLRDVVRQMVDLVAAQYGQRVPPAALQALIWYPEQELYKGMGVKLRVTSQDYAGAARKILESEGVDVDRINAAIQSAQPGSGQARPDDGQADAGTVPGNDQGPGRARPLEADERTRLLVERNRQVVEARAAARAAAAQPSDVLNQSRIGLDFRDVIKRNPALQQAAQQLLAGEITAEQYDELVNQTKPVEPYTEVPPPATTQAMQDALTSDKVDRIGTPAATLEAGHPVGLRLDIPAYSNHGTWVVSVHEQQAGFAAGKSIGYESVASATDVSFGVVEKAAANIAAGKPKATIATIKGAWKPTTPEQAKADADAALNDPAWVQVGMDPERHSYFYDRATMEPVVSADEVIQIGPLVLAKNATYGNKQDFLFQTLEDDMQGQVPFLEAKAREAGFASIDEWAAADIGAFMVAAEQWRESNPAVELAQGKTQTDTPAFKRWFGDSKVVDENGEPLVVYHGTPYDNQGLFKDMRNGRFNLGFHFGTQQAANDVLDSVRYDYLEGKHVLPVYLSIKNPIEFDIDADRGFHKPSDLYQMIMQKAEKEGVPGITEDDIDAFYRDEHTYKGKSFTENVNEPEHAQLVKDWITQKLGVDGFKYVNAAEDPGSISWIALEPTQIKSATGNNGEFDPNNPSIVAQPARGTFSPSRLELTLLKDADLSTFLHETGHFFLEVLADISSQAGAPADVQADMAAVLKWFGVPDVQTWLGYSLEQKRPYHEKFAESFEQYLFEGKAPSAELKPLFRRFREFLTSVYKSLKDFTARYNTELTDEVRGVFDRLIATEAQIREAERQAGMLPNFEATNEAIERLGARSLRDLKWVVNARSKILKQLQRDVEEKRKAMREEVTLEVRAMPEYAVQRFLKNGELRDPETGEVTKVEGGKLSLPVLKEIYGEDPAALWRYIPTNMVTANAETGLHPNMVAELFGYANGDEMVRAVLAAMPEASAIDGLTDQRLLERYGDLVTPKGIEQAANEAIHNEARARFVATQLKALREGMNQREKTPAGGSVNVIVKAAKEFALNLVGRRKVRDLKPGLHTAAEARAARKAEEATAKGDTQAAIIAKRDQLLSHYAARFTTEAQAEIDRKIDYLRKFEKDSVRAKIPREYLDQIDKMLERVDLRRSTSLREIDKRAKLAAWIASQQELGLDPNIPEYLLEDAQLVSYKDMTVEEFRGLVDAIRNIEHLGRLKDKLLTLQEQREFAAVVQEIETSIRDNATKERPVRINAPTNVDRAKDAVRAFFSMHRKLSSLVRQMDGLKDGGAFWNALIRPMNAAADQEAVERNKATTQLAKIFEPLMKSSKLKQKVYIPAINQSLSLETRLVVALNWGNDANRQRIMDGDKWSSVQVDAILATLTPAQLEFVQKVWDYVDTFWPNIKAKEERVSGTAPDKVEAAPFTVTTADGTEVQMRGGYYPIKYDPDRSSKAEADTAAEITQQMLQGQYTRATTRRGHTKARVDTVNRPVRKDIGVVFEHVNQVIHDLAWHEWLIDATRLLRAGPIDSAIRETMGPEVLRDLKEGLKDIAAGEVPAQNQFERAINHLRNGTTIVGMGWNLMTALMQPLGLTQSMVRIGPMWVGKGLATWLGDAAKMENSAKAIYEKSDFMRMRGETLNREINEIRNKVQGEMAGPVKETYFYLIQKLQLVVDLPTWLGAYEKAQAEGFDEDRSVALADQAVRDAQGAGQVSDLARIQRGGPLQKLFTNFYNYFNTTYNLTAERFNATKFSNPLQAGRFMVDMLLLYTVPAVLGALLKEAVRGGGDDEDELVEKLIREQLNYLLGTMVGLRELGAAVNGFSGYEGPAGTRFFSEVAKLGKQAEQGELDEALLKRLNNTAGILLHYPAGQVNRTVEGYLAYTEGRTDNPLALVVGPPPRN